jgi:hypothetical protein
MKDSGFGAIQIKSSWIRVPLAPNAAAAGHLDRESKVVYYRRKSDDDQ